MANSTKAHILDELLPLIKKENPVETKLAIAVSFEDMWAFVNSK